MCRRGIYLLRLAVSVITVFVSTTPDVFILVHGNQFSDVDFVPVCSLHDGQVAFGYIAFENGTK